MKNKDLKKGIVQDLFKDKTHLRKCSLFDFDFCLFFSLSVHCSFDLGKIIHLSIQSQGVKSESTLRQEGLLRTEMRFAKGSRYYSFISEFSYLLF